MASPKNAKYLGNLCSWSVTPSSAAEVDQQPDRLLVSNTEVYVCIYVNICVCVCACITFILLGCQNKYSGISKIVSMLKLITLYQCDVIH